MPVSDTPWTSDAPDGARVELVRLDTSAVDALAARDLDRAARIAGLPLTSYLVADECVPVWRMRSLQLRRSPEDADWVTRLVVRPGGADGTDGAVVGRAGFHGAPDAHGMVEVGYSVDPDHRRRGYARAALETLVAVARDAPGVTTVRACIRPDNTPSRTLVDAYGFEAVGEQWDDEDGLETILELTL
jgi:[ribosomal protein S5]-alanine N-acetyltransferase